MWARGTVSGILGVDICRPIAKHVDDYAVCGCSAAM